MEAMKPGHWVVGYTGEKDREILRVTEDGKVFVRNEKDELVKVALLPREVERLRQCSEAMQAIEVLAAIIARLGRLN